MDDLFDFIKGHHAAVERRGTRTAKIYEKEIVINPVNAGV